jgi:hypothetical protein
VHEALRPFAAGQRGRGGRSVKVRRRSALTAEVTVLTAERDHWARQCDYRHTFLERTFVPAATRKCWVEVALPG